MSVGLVGTAGPAVRGRRSPSSVALLRRVDVPSLPRKVSLNRQAQDFGRRLYHLLFGDALMVGLLLARLGGMFQQ